LHTLTGTIRTGSLRADTLHIQREVHFAGFLELERERHLVALLERVFEIHQHQVIPARRELYGLAGINGETLVELAHRHHAIVHGHFVHLDLARDGARAADQPIGSRALVLDRQVATGDFGATRRRAAPGLRDDEITSLDL